MKFDNNIVKEGLSLRYKTCRELMASMYLLHIDDSVQLSQANGKICGGSCWDSVLYTYFHFPLNGLTSVSFQGVSVFPVIDGCSSCSLKCICVCVCMYVCS